MTEEGKVVDGDEPMWESVSVEIATEKGTKEVPAVVHSQLLGVAVTMSNFGEFTVTHTGTGRRVAGPFERVGSACLEAVRWATLFDMTAGAIGLAAQVNDDPVPEDFGTVMSGGETRPMTKREWVGMRRNWLLSDEFPWESPEDHPGTVAEKMLAALPSRSSESAP